MNRILNGGYPISGSFFLKTQWGLSFPPFEENSLQVLEGASLGSTTLV